MTQTKADEAPTAPPAPLEASSPSRANATFAGVSTGAAVTILVLLAAVATFLFVACVLWGTAAVVGVPGWAPDWAVPPLPGLE